ncbi:MAG: hypothetical protein V7752_18060 [Halopseudomonas sp.]
MFLLSLLQRTFQRIDQRASEHLTQQQLRKLDPHLLEDIGFKLDGNRVLPLHPVLPSAHQSAALLATPEAATTAQPEIEHSILSPQPKGSGG